jgi:hypothetical protein
VTPPNPPTLDLDRLEQLSRMGHCDWLATGTLLELIRRARDLERLKAEVAELREINDDLHAANTIVDDELQAARERIGELKHHLTSALARSSRCFSEPACGDCTICDAYAALSPAASESEEPK